MKQIIKFTTILSVIFFLSSQLNAQEECFPKKRNALVIDETGTLSPGQVQQLNNKLVQYSNSTSTQILVVLVKDLCGYDAAMYTTELGHKWGVGQEGKDNGAVIMIKPTGGQGQRKVHIATGYGLEGVIPDAIGKRIVEKEMIPRFQNGDIYGGIDAATNVIMELAAGEYTADDYNNRAGGSTLPFFIIILFIFFIMFVSRIGNARKYARTNHTSLWMALFLMSSMNNHRGHYGNFSSGRGGFGGGGFSGGGFGGFGGGGFGGGGAGGSW